MKKEKNKLKYDDRVQLIINKKVKWQFHDFLKLINGVVLPLFWEVGKLIEDLLISEDNCDKEKIIHELAETLQSVFGNYFDSRNLELMHRFATKCDYTTMMSISPVINWEYIPSLLKLRSGREWPVYMQYIHLESLSPKKFEEISFSEQSFPLEINKDRVYDFLKSDATAFYDSTFNFYFGTNENVKTFNHVFNIESHLSSFGKNGALKESLTVFMKTLEKKITNSSADLYYKLNLTYNNLLFDLGADLLNIEKIQDIVIDSEYLKEFIKKLGSGFQEKFDFEDLFYAVEFARKNLDASVAIHIGQRLSWYSIRELLKISVDVFPSNFMSLSNDSSMNKILQAEDRKDILKGDKNKHQRLTITTEFVESSSSERNSIELNIFKNPSLMRFLLS